MNTKLWVASVVASMSLTACGGGGGAEPVVASESTDPDAVDYCVVDLQVQLGDKIACSNGEITVTADVRTNWNTRIRRVESQKGWVTIAQVPETSAEVFVPLNRGLSRLDSFECRSFSDIDLKDRLEDVNAGEIAEKINSIHFWPTEDGDITVSSAFTSGDGDILTLSYSKTTTADPVIIPERPDDSDGDQI